MALVGGLFTAGWTEEVLAAAADHGIAMVGLPVEYSISASSPQSAIVHFALLLERCVALKRGHVDAICTTPADMMPPEDPRIVKLLRDLAAALLDTASLTPSVRLSLRCNIHAAFAKHSALGTAGSYAETHRAQDVMPYIIDELVPITRSAWIEVPPYTADTPKILASVMDTVKKELKKY